MAARRPMPASRSKPSWLLARTTPRRTSRSHRSSRSSPESWMRGDEPPAMKPSVDDLFARLKASRADCHRPRGAGGGRAGRGARRCRRRRRPSRWRRRERGGDRARHHRPDRVVRARGVAVRAARRGGGAAGGDPGSAVEARARRRAERSPRCPTRPEAVRSIDALLPPEAEHVAAYVSTAVDDLAAAARLGAASLSQDSAELLARRIADADVVAKVSATIGQDLVVPLRERIERAVADADGDQKELGTHLRSIYREWKTQRLDDHALALLNAAYARGGGELDRSRHCGAVDGGPDRGSVLRCRDQLSSRHGSIRRRVPDRGSHTSVSPRVCLPTGGGRPVASPR